MEVKEYVVEVKEGVMEVKRKLWSSRRILWRSRRTSGVEIMNLRIEVGREMEEGVQGMDKDLRIRVDNSVTVEVE